MLPKRFCLALIAVFFLALPVGSAQAQMNDLIGLLTSQLGVTETQAAGGAGSLFGAAKEQMSPGDFKTVEEGLPGVDGLIDQAPEPSESSSLLSSGSSLLGGSGSEAASMGTVVSSFESLGMSPEMVQQFVPIVTKYAGDVGGPEVAQLLKAALAF
ncbi:MAG: DUF2780 domain-containing protein [Pseudomonadota bacterium]